MKNRIEISRLFEIGVEILEHAGTGRDNAGIQGDALLSAELRGHPSHEFLRLPRLAERIEAGVVHPNGRGSFSRHGNSVSQVDGRRGLEPVVMGKAIRRLQELVSDREIAMAYISNSNHRCRRAPRRQSAWVAESTCDGGWLTPNIIKRMQPLSCSNNRSTDPLTSSHWGTYRARKDAVGRLSLVPFEDDPDPSPIGSGMLEVRDGPLRITGPAIRRSWLEKGAGAAGERRGLEPFVQVSWEEAERRIAEELARVKRNFGNEAIFGGSYGWASAGRFHHAQSQLKRFLNCAGEHTSSVNTYSYAAAEVMIPHVLGSFRDH